jgi:anti-sigma regulatory factor (Ser/Thr protein kinase)
MNGAGGRSQSLHIPMLDPSRVAEARRAIGALAAESQLPEADVGRAQIITTELANNILRHARDGFLIARALQESEGHGIEITAIDRGPGMDLARCLADGFSTGGTPGTGLGAVRRLSDSFDAYSLPSGSIAVARVLASGATAQPAARPPVLQIGAVCLPKAGEEMSGDAWAAASMAGGRTLIVVADGLGHGPLAADASAVALAAFHDEAPSGRGPAEILGEIHRRLRSTRGAAVAIAEISPASEEIRFAGLGNVAAVVISGAARRGLVSHNGIAGGTPTAPRELSYPFAPHSLLVMASDGIGTHWDLVRYAGAASHHPAVVSALLCRDFSRGRDDLTVVAVREGG